MTDYTIASPNGGTWSIQSSNTAKTGRYHDLMFVQEGAAGSGNVFSKARTGILVGAPGTSGSQLPGAGMVTATSGLGWAVQPFCAVVERSSLVGPYFVQSTAVGNGALATSDPSQIRVDRLDVQVLDGALGDNGGTSKTSVKVTQGTPGAGVPTAPAGTTPLGWWTIPANAATLFAATWTPARKSTALRGAIRLLLEGDALSDPGFDSGEWRDTGLFSPAQGGGTLDRWNAASGAWELETPLAGLHEVDFASTASIPTNHPHAMGWGTVTQSSQDVTLSAGGPDTVASGVITFNRSGLWQVNVSIDCPPPSSPVNTTAFRVRAPTDTGTIIFGSGSNTQTSDGGPVRITAGTQWSVIVVQQTGSTQTVTSRFRAALLRG
ncbi:MAG TPA: hypothetical protein VHX38_02165 [Pseudonocardiaceae bacterium]|nr:hypothetical protein [Pseudonocardiaceae bacterium]